MSETQQDADRQFRALLDYLKHARGLDLTGYKPAGLQRRIQKRMRFVDIASYEDYIDYLQVYPQEFTELLNTILINVTSFFRDSATWEYLQQELIPSMLRQKAQDEPFRVWCAGVATGQEAYSVAMCLCEVLGEAEFRTRIKIYATDIDEDALSQARQGAYQQRELSGIPEPMVARYFEPGGARWVFRKDLRHSIIFGHHDLMQDPPIPRVDLLLSRNTLMYFNSEAQARVLSRFHFALNGSGHLVLGRAEVLFTHPTLFQPIDLKRRVFARLPGSDLRDRTFGPIETSKEIIAHKPARQMNFRDLAFEASPVPQIVIDGQGQLVTANDRAQAVFSVGTRDVGRALVDLPVGYRAGHLRAVVQQTLTQGQPGVATEIEWPMSGATSDYFDILVTPLYRNRGILAGASLSFLNVTAQHKIEAEYEQATEELETSLEELQSINEELETTNEELQSINEELETTNEELQSTNEELETMNEEQQATNEELEGLNDELHMRTQEMDNADTFFQSVMASLRAGVVVLDRDMKVLVWNRKAEDLWGMRSDEAIGQHFLNLDIGFPVDQSQPAIRACLSNRDEHPTLQLVATNRRGRRFECRVQCLPLLYRDQEIQGAIVLMEDGDR